jgi:hypothetical protein
VAWEACTCLKNVEVKGLKEYFTVCTAYYPDKLSSASMDTEICINYLPV